MCSSGVPVWAFVTGDDITILWRVLCCRYIQFGCAGALDINDCSNSIDADFSNTLYDLGAYHHPQIFNVMAGP